MQVLEKILQEIEADYDVPFFATEAEGRAFMQGKAAQAREDRRIIRSHMEDDERYVTNGEYVWLEDVVGGRFVYLPKRDEPVSNPCKLEDGWIPVEERLPDEGEKVWVTLKCQNGFSEIRGSIFKEGDFWESKYIAYINVIAWMPRFIPMPYQPKEEKNNEV